MSVQQQVLPRVSVEAGYNRRWLNNFTVVDNALQLNSDYTSFSLTAPLDPRLPNGGGYNTGTLYNANPNVASLTNNVTTQAENYGTQINSSHGVLLNVSARPRNGLVFQGGLSSGNTRNDYCDIRAGVARADRRRSAEPDQPVVQYLDRMAHAVHRPRFVHPPESRRADLGNVQERQGR